MALFSLFVGVGVAGAAGLGCGGNSSSTFPEGLEPLETNKANWPAAQAGDPHPEAISFKVGSGDDYEWAHAKAYVHAPLAKTWAALRDPDACADRKSITSWTVTRDVESGYDYSYRIHNVVEDVVTVEFDNTWRHGVVDGTLSDPEQIAARYQKTWGSNYLTLLRGSVVARQTDDQTSEVEFIEHIDAMGQDYNTAKRTINDYFLSVVALAHDKPLP